MKFKQRFKRTLMKKYFTDNQVKLLAVFTLFAIIYCLISLVNHYQLRTYALDLGMYNNALYSFAHFKNAYFTLGIDGIEMPFLGTHFSVILIFLSPFYFVFGSYTLLIIQIIAILAGGFAIYKYSKIQFSSNSIIPLIILIQFFSIWGIYSALSFDFHCNVIGAMLVPWFIYYLERRKLIQASIFLLLVLFSMETMSIWVFFIIIGLMIKNWKEYKKEYLKFEIPAAIFCLLYGVIVIGIVMPSLQGTEGNLQFGRYSHLGNSLGAILLTMIKSPLHTFSLLFKNTLSDPVYNGIKQEFLIMVLVSGGIALLFRPVYLLMLIPIFAQKLLSNDYALWGINGQYSIELVPILSIAFIDLVKNAKKYKVGIAVFVALTTLFFTFNSLDHRTSKWYDKTNSRFYSGIHYKSDIDVTKIKNALKVIDNDSKVSVISCLAPYLAFRDKIYHFPIVKDADYIALILNKKGTYPLSVDAFNEKIVELKNSGVYKVIYEDNDLLILKK